MNTPKKTRNTTSNTPASGRYAGEDQNAPSSSSGNNQSDQEIERVGDVLREVRQQRGERLMDIAETLCIRPNYLAALENSRYEEIPADAYVIGFLRTYASYLGLDGRAAIDHYRKEMAGHRKKPQLNMPQPVSEGQAPSAAILIGAIVVAFVIYIGWYALSDSPKVAVEPPIPVIEQQPATNNTLTPADTIAIPPAQTEPVGTPQQATPAVEAPKQETKAPEPKQPDTTTKQQTPVTPEKKGESPKPTATTETSTEDSIEETDQEETPVAHGIVLKAVKKCWVHIVDEAGRVPLDRVLNAGETYKVPDQKGLKLTVGNGNGLIVSLDGTDLPFLGDSSKVVRDVSLTPEDLLKNANSQKSGQ